jgi:peptidyl-prolyl cis-trans isomerase A (cyclophilin A)
MRIAIPVALTTAVLALAGTAYAQNEKPVVVLETTMGEIVLELDGVKAPITTANFLKYVESGHYDGTVFHRVIPRFMIQGGGFTADLKEKDTLAPIKNESGNGLSNVRGTVAMARTNDPNSATAQFFINHVDNKPLDTYGGGYAVFGKVIKGMDVVDKIAAVKTTTKGTAQGPLEDVPVEAIVIKSAKVQSTK